MLSAGLEAVIQKGKATMHTFTYGGGAVGHINVPQNKFIIIHHFDYWHFIDVPEVPEASPASANIAWKTFPDAGPFTAFFDFGTIGNFFAVQDFSDQATSLATVQALWLVLMPGGSSTGAFDPLFGLLVYTFTTSTPGTVWNGQPATMASTGIVPPPGFVSFPGVFARGADAIMTPGLFLTHHTHQLEFRSKKSRNHFVIQEPVVLFPSQATPPPISDGNTFFVYMGGTVYEKDTYLVHNESVQINVLGVPDVDVWGVNFSQLALESQENPLPVGYGIAGAGLNTARQILFNPAGVPADIEQYLPLSAEFESILPITGSYRNQFKVDANSQNQLFNPKNKGGIYGNFPTYPLINIDYVLVDMNYNEFVKGTS